MYAHSFKWWRKINEIIDYYKEKYKDATHNCVAYLVGTKERANDDGEPSGTAGLQCSMF